MKTAIPLSLTLLLTCLATACQKPASPPPTTAAAEPPPMTAASEPTATAMATGALRRLSLEEVGVSWQASTLCNLEYLGTAIFTNADAEVAADAKGHFSGWIGDEIARSPAQDASLRFESVADRSQVWDTPLTLGTKRDDVVASFHESKLELAGFSQEVALNELPAGRYHLYMTYPSQGKRFLCDNGRYIVKGN